MNLPTKEFSSLIEGKEKELNQLLVNYQKKYDSFMALDLSEIGNPRFAEHLKDLEVMEASLDALIKQELDSLALAQRKFAQAVSNHSKDVSAIANEVNKLYQAYEVNKIEYGGAKDYKRYAAFTDLFSKTQELYSILNVGPAKSKFKMFIDGFIALSKKVKNLVSLSMRLTLPAVQMMSSAFQKITKTRVGFGESVDRFFFKWGKISDITVEVKNSKYLDDQKRLRIFIPTHRDANLDSVAFAALKTENPAIFGALNLKNHPIFGMKDNPLVQPMIKSLEQNDSFILAGAPEKPIDKFLRLYKENKIKNALIYPEGQVGLGIKESRPIRENFSKAFLAKLVEEGIDFELVPVSYVNGAQYFEYHNEIGKIKTESGQNKLVVNVQKPISATEIRQFLDRFDSKQLNTYLRFRWLFDLDTDKDHILGQGRWKNIQAAFQNKFGKPRCSTVLKEFLIKSRGP